MTAVTQPQGRDESAGTMARARAILRDYPLVPLLILLALLVVIQDIQRPGVVDLDWVGGIVRNAIPLAILAACQTLAMLTGGIDLSVAQIASMSGFLVATLVGPVGLPMAIVYALIASAAAGVVSGIGIGIFRVHPLIMTLAMSLVILGLANVWQLQMVQTGSGVPAEFRTIGAGMQGGIVPNQLLVFIPLALLIMLMLRRTGYGRMLYAVGDNPIAARLSGAKSWQILLVLYILSAVLAGIAGFLQSGATNTASVTVANSLLLPSVAAAVIGGTSIFGGRGGYGGTMVGALILAVATALLTSLGFPESVRQIVFGAIIILVAAAYTRVTSQG